MSRYTIQLRDVINIYGIEEVLSWFKSYELSDYLTEDEIKAILERGTWSKDKLAEKIVNHYLFYEIGFETPMLFAHQVKVQMNEMMEEYLPLIYSASIKFDPLVNVDFTEEFHQQESGNAKNSGNSESSASSSGDGLTINSDTPQGNINKNEVLAGKYATSTSGSDTSSSSSDSTSTNSNTDTSSESSYIKKTKGNSGVSATAQALIMQYRNMIRAFDREIVEKLEPNFMGIY